MIVFCCSCTWWELCLSLWLLTKVAARRHFARTLMSNTWWQLTRFTKHRFSGLTFSATMVCTGDIHHSHITIINMQNLLNTCAYISLLVAQKGFQLLQSSSVTCGVCTESLHECCELSQLWYREFFLEMTMGKRIQVNTYTFIHDCRAQYWCSNSVSLSVCDILVFLSKWLSVSLMYPRHIVSTFIIIC